MAKMRIFEIARSIQEQRKEIKSSDLVKLLNDNGFEAKGPNSNIEDEAIGFLLKTFANKKQKETKQKQKVQETGDVTIQEYPMPDKQVTGKQGIGKQDPVANESVEAKKETKQEIKKKEPIEVKQQKVQNNQVNTAQNRTESNQQDTNQNANHQGTNQSDNNNNRPYTKPDANRPPAKQDNNGGNYQSRPENRGIRTNANRTVGYNNNNANRTGGYNNSNRSGVDNTGSNSNRTGGYNNSTNNNNRTGGYNNSTNNNNRTGGYNNSTNNNNRTGGYSNSMNNNNRTGGYSNNTSNNNRTGGYSNNTNNNNRTGGYSNSTNNNNRTGGYNTTTGNNANRTGGYNNNNRTGGYNNTNSNSNYNRGTGTNTNYRGTGNNNRPTNTGGRTDYRHNNNRPDSDRGGQPQSGIKVIEKFEKNQNNFDSIRPEQKSTRNTRGGKNQSANKYGKKSYDSHEKSKFSKDALIKKKDPNRKGAFIKPVVVKQVEPEDTIKTIEILEKLTIKELADKMKVPAAGIVKKLFLQGKMVSINQEITFEEAEEIALEYNCIVEMEKKVDVIAELLKEDEEDEETMVKRPPVVCVMGHVDHGKTSLLDAIREANVTEREAGGITQHIGAYVVEVNDEKITFLDTPGHEAFTSMRMRGAKSTDIAILVVAADDGVMPQTVEAINHAKAAGVEIIVAINKIDKQGANIERVKQELVEHELIAEDWGGSTVFVPVSAHTKEGIDQLLEMIVLTSEVCELKANKDRQARGIVIEAQLDKGKGPVATILVQKGTLNVGDHIVIGSAFGKVRAMMDDRGRRLKTAGPSTPVEILGLNEVPNAGEVFMATESDKEARNIAEAYIKQGREKLLDDTKAKLSLDGLFSQIQAGNIKELNLIVKADVQGSVEAVKQSLLKLSNEEVAIRIIHGGVGAINESDVSLAIASSAIIIGFNIRPDNMAKEAADREKVDMRLYHVIYNAIEDIEAAMKGMLEPIFEEKIIGHAEVRQVFKASGLGTIAGSYLLDGKIVRNCKVRIFREGVEIFNGALASLKRFKDDVKEVAAGYECGLVIEKFNDIKEEDKVEAYIMEEVPR